LSIDADLYDALEKRAKKEMLDIDELILDIIRRSMLSYKKNPAVEDKTDDALVRLFSRRQRETAAKKPVDKLATPPASELDPLYKSELKQATQED